MVPDESNEFFEHLNKPATPRRIRRPSSSQNPKLDDFGSVPDPFGDEVGPEHPLSSSGASAALPERGRARSRAPKGPGLSPGIPQVRDDKPQTREIPRGSGVVLTPSGVKRLTEDPPVRKVESTPEPGPEPPADDFHEASRNRNDKDDVSWEEYAADGFPAMAAEEFGVKVKTTDSGRVVPVGVRPDLTEEAMKGKSIKGGGGGGAGAGRKPRPMKPSQGGPKSFWGKVGDSLRLTKPVLDDEEETGEEDSTEAKPSKGFAKAGSLPNKGKGGRTRKTPLGVAWSVVVEVAKILMLVLLLRAYVVQVSQVQGPSMEGTLEQDDRLIVERVTPLIVNNADKWWVSWLPGFLTPEYERGDIVVVRSPEDPGAELVKRLIGLPGDTIKFEDGKLFIKPAGSSTFEEVKEDYLTSEELKNEDGTFRSYSAGDLGDFIDEGDELVVPADRIFVMGDNRTHSNDSRRWLEIDVNRTEPPGIDRLWLHKSSVEGRVIFRIWPFGRMWPPVK
jgi:signal peptidase I